MKTNFFYLAVAIATTSLFCYSESAGAQAIIVEEDVSVTEVVPTKPRYYSDSHKNNWFISIGAGGQTFLTEHVGDAQYTLAMDFAIGKWISPYLGFRLSAMGGALHTNWPLAEGVMTHMRYAAVYGDIMWNMFNTFHGYNEDRVFSIIPFAGAGGIYSFHNTPYNNKTYAFPITAGIKLNFRLSHYVDFFLEGRGNLIGDHFNGIVEGTEVESVISAIGGFSIKFGKDRFKAYDAYADQMVIGDLNNRVNALRAQLNECESRVVECPPCPEAVVEEVTVIEPAACSQPVGDHIVGGYDVRICIWVERRSLIDSNGCVRIDECRNRDRRHRRHKYEILPYRRRRRMDCRMDKKPLIKAIIKRIVNFEYYPLFATSLSNYLLSRTRKYDNSIPIIIFRI